MAWKANGERIGNEKTEAQSPDIAFLPAYQT